MHKPRAYRRQFPVFQFEISIPPVLKLRGRSFLDRCRQHGAVANTELQLAVMFDRLRLENKECPDLQAKLYPFIL